MTKGIKTITLKMSNIRSSKNCWCVKEQQAQNFVIQFVTLEIYLNTICSFCLTDTHCASVTNIRPFLLRKWELFIEEDRNV